MARQKGLFFAFLCAGMFITIEPGRADFCVWDGFVDASCDIVAPKAATIPHHENLIKTG